MKNVEYLRHQYSFKFWILAHHWPMGWQAKKFWPEPILGQLCFGPQWAGPKPSQMTLKARAGSSRAGPWPDTTLSGRLFAIWTQGSIYSYNFVKSNDINSKFLSRISFDGKIYQSWYHAFSKPETCERLSRFGKLFCMM